MLYSDKASGEANGTKTPKFTAEQSVGSPQTGYFVFYRGKGTDMKVVTPSFISFRVDGTYFYDEVLNNVAQLDYSTDGKHGSKTFIDTLSRAMNGKGTTLLFTQGKGSSQVTTDKDQVGWPSAKEAKYKFTGKKTAPTVKLGVDHLVPLKSGQEYRIVDASDTSKKSDWVAVDDYHVTETGGKKKVNKVYLEDLIVTGSGITGDWVADKKLTATALATGNVKLQVRTAASAKGVASKIYSAVVSMKAIDANVSSTASIAYTVPYDKTKGVTIKNTSGKDIEYTLTATTAAVLAGKWKSIKADKDVKLKDKDLKDQKYILVRVAGDKKAGIIASDFKPTVINDLAVVEQKITEVAANTAFAGVTNAKYQVTTAGAVTITIPKAAVSGTAIETKTVEVTVENVTNPGTLKWASKGSNKNFTIDVPTFASNKVTFKFAVKKDATGDSGEYKCAVEGLNFTFKVVIGD
ncbi:MAG: hypothetical protein J6Z02_01345 [Lachnospiraceae bacterium]|nr:hypothetical protein [Lachnospiraceae bacterium]